MTGTEFLGNSISLESAMAAVGCDFNRSMQHLSSHYRAGGVDNEAKSEKIFHSDRDGRGRSKRPQFDPAFGAIRGKPIYLSHSHFLEKGVITRIASDGIESRMQLNKYQPWIAYGIATFKRCKGAIIIAPKTVYSGDLV